MKRFIKYAFIGALAFVFASCQEAAKSEEKSE